MPKSPIPSSIRAKFRTKLAAAALLGISAPALYADATPPTFVNTPADLTGVSAIEQTGRVVVTPTLETDITPGGFWIDDNLAGTHPITPAANLPPLAPGSYTIDWTLFDDDGTAATHQQSFDIKIIPTVSLAADQTVFVGSTNVTVNIDLALNITAPSDVTVPISINTSAGLTAAPVTTATLGSGTSTTNIAIEIDAATVADNAEYVITMGTPTNATLGYKESHTVSVTKSNLAPIADLAATHNGLQTRTIIKDADTVTINANAADANSDNITYTWQLIKQADDTIAATGSATTFTFITDSSGLNLDTGFYTAEVTLTDDNVSGALSSTHSLLLELIAPPAPSLTAADSDGDGSPDNDAAEGITDSDNDGIVNYLDPPTAAHLLPGTDLSGFVDNPQTDVTTLVTSTPDFSYRWQLNAAAANNKVNYAMLLRTDPGHKLSLGDGAFKNGNGHARINTFEAETLLGSAVPDGLASTDTALIDIEISGLSAPGDYATLIYPLLSPIPQNTTGSAQMHILNRDNNWQLFDLGNSQPLTGSALVDGYCPTDADDYNPVITTLEAGSGGHALQADHQCFRLVVKDGGQNDHDGLVNGKIRIVAAPLVSDGLAPTFKTIPADKSSTRTNSAPVSLLNFTDLIGAGFDIDDNSTADDTVLPPATVAPPTVDTLVALPAGLHTITWQLSDSQGNTAKHSQKIDVLPYADFSIDQTGSANSTVRVEVLLDGKTQADATIPLTLGSGPAGFTLPQNSITIPADSTSATMDIAIPNDLTPIVINLGADGDFVNALKGDITSHTITVVSANQPPRAELVALQDETASRIVERSTSAVVIRANAYDAEGDNINYQWSIEPPLTDTNNLANLTDQAEYQFLPTVINTGLYTVKLTIEDDNAQKASREHSLLIKVVDNIPLESGIDIDADGTSDRDEGFIDRNNNGISDYLDPPGTTNYQLPAWPPEPFDTARLRSGGETLATSGLTYSWTLEPGTASGLLNPQMVLSTLPGLKLSLGADALLAGRSHARSKTHAFTPTLPAKSASLDSYLIDVEISNLESNGGVATLIFPQKTPIDGTTNPSAKMWVVDSSNTWQEFKINAADNVYGAPLDNGFCPAPDSPAYDALGVGDQCVKLTITDGDLTNDRDGVANGRVRIVGAVLSDDKTAPEFGTAPTDLTGDSAIKLAEQPVAVLTLQDHLAKDGLTVTSNTTPDSTISPSASLPPLPPGEHAIDWELTDENGNTSTVTQTVQVLPTVNLQADQTVIDNNTVTVKAVLNGNPITAYPVTIPVTISPNTGHNGGTTSNITINSGTEGALSFNLDGSNTEGDQITIAFDLSQLPGTVLKGNRDTHTVTITKANIAPRADLSIEQNTVTRRTVIKGNGQVTISSNPIDEDGAAALTYAWTISARDPNNTNNLNTAVVGDLVSQTFVFNPDDAAITTGFYTAELTLTDTDAATTIHAITLEVIESVTGDTDNNGIDDSLTSDSDADGSIDENEGALDADNNSINDYLDPLLSDNTLPGTALLTYIANAKTTDTAYYPPDSPPPPPLPQLTYSWTLTTNNVSNLLNYPMMINTQPGHKLSLGPVSFENSISHSRIDIDAFLITVGGAINNEERSTDNNIIEFEISSLSLPGQSAFVVIPLTEAVLSNHPFDARFYIMSGAGNWEPFNSDLSKNKLSASTRTDGYCAPATAYSNINNEHILPPHAECLTLLIEDGGANDRDNEVNGKILIAGAVIYPASPPPFIDTEVPKFENSVGAGSAPGNVLFDSTTLTADRPVTLLPIDQVLSPVSFAIFDNSAGEITITPSADLAPLPPGAHTLRWTLTDAANNQVIHDQLIEIQPTISFAADQKAVDFNGSMVTIKALLNGNAPSYPVDVPVAITPASGHDGGISTTLSITGGTEGSVSLTLDGSSIEDDTITLTLGAPVGALTGDKDTHVITLTKNNLKPSAELSAVHNGNTTRTIIIDSNIVTVTATPRDSSGTTFTYDWSAGDNSLIRIPDTPVDDLSKFKFNPAGLTPGYYPVNLTISDHLGESSEHALLLQVVSAPLFAIDVDSDDDGSNDIDESVFDDDNDGIQNYLDPIATANLLPAWPLETFRQNAKKSDRVATESPNLSYSWELLTSAGNKLLYPMLITTLPGHTLSLGEIAFREGLGHARVRTQNVSSQLGISLQEGIINADGYLVDIEISGLNAYGDSTAIVIPQSAPIPPSLNGSAFFQILDHSNAWQAFDLTGTDTLGTSTLSSDYCPQPSAATAYTAIPPSGDSHALIDGHQCLRLVIQDGGPNDRDNKINGRIRLTGAVFVPDSPSIPAEEVLATPASINSDFVTQNNTDAGNGGGESGGGGGGATSLYLLLIALGLSVIGARKIRF